MEIEVHKFKNGRSRPGVRGPQLVVLWVRWVSLEISASPQMTPCQVGPSGALLSKWRPPAEPGGISKQAPRVRQMGASFDTEGPPSAYSHLIT